MPISYEFIAPERIIFGQGVVRQLGDCVKDLEGEKVLIVTDEILSSLEIFKDIINSLKDAGINYHLYTKVDPNPTDVQVEEGAKIYNEENADVIVAVGGGSSIDSAKAIGILANNGGSIKDYQEYGSVINRIPPLITIPTTAGTGSEVTAWAVITNTEKNYKMCPGGPKLLPNLALVDPVMSSSMPSNLTAATGIDALSHAIEAIVSPFAMPQTDALAFSAVKLIVNNIGPAVATGSNMAARENMAMAALEAGLAGNAWVGGIHALGHQLSTQYGLAHGVAIGIMMPYVMNFNLIACIDRFNDIAIAMGESVDGLSKIEAAHKAPRAVFHILESLGLPTSLKETGANPDLIPVCAKWALEDIDIPGNPRSLTLDQIEKLFQTAFEGKLGVA